MAFGKAFAAARKAGKKVFTYNGKKYNTKLAADTPEKGPIPESRPDSDKKVVKPVSEKSKPVSPVKEKSKVVKPAKATPEKPKAKRPAKASSGPPKTSKPAADAPKKTNLFDKMKAGMDKSAPKAESFRDKIKKKTAGVGVLKGNYKRK